MNTSKSTDKSVSVKHWFFTSSDIPPGGSVSCPPFGGIQSKKFHLTLSKSSPMDDEVDDGVDEDVDREVDKKVELALDLHLNTKCAQKLVWFKSFIQFNTPPSQGWSSSDPLITLAFSPDRTVINLATFRSARTWNFLCEVTFEDEDEDEADHATQFSAQMSTLRLDASSADITLLTTADGRSFPAHKLILSTRSPVFAAMFRNGDFTENQKKLVEIDDISGEVMEGLLKYVYECNVQGIEKIVCGLLTAADKYDIPHLVKECIQVMSNNLSVTNAASFFYYANLHQFENLKIQIDQFIVANKVAIRQSEGFKKWIKPHSDLVDQFIDLII